MELKKAWDFVNKFMLDYGVNEPSDVDLMFCEILKKNRAELCLIREISLSEFEEIMDIARKRVNNIPLQRIFGKTNFYGLEFELNDDTLIPRFDTEIIVEQALKLIKKNKMKQPKILDLCTGTGCIAISIAKNSDAIVTAVDINENALNMAKKNAKNNFVDINFIQSDMFDKINDKYDIIISNPPYIKRADIPFLEPLVKDHEPYIALDGGESGMDFYKIIEKDAKKHLNTNGKIFMEIDRNQGESVANLFKVCYTNTEIVKDLQKNDRVVIVSL